MGILKHFRDSGDNQLGLSQVLNNLGLAYLEKFKLKSAKLSFDKAHEIIHEHFE